jgi:hypothetical protein
MIGHSLPNDPATRGKTRCDTEHASVTMVAMFTISSPVEA